MALLICGKKIQKKVKKTDEETIVAYFRGIGQWNDMNKKMHLQKDTQGRCQCRPNQSS